MKANPKCTKETVPRAGGFTRITAVILALTLVLLVITVVPFVTRWREDSAAFNCALSVEKMQNLLDMEVLFRQRAMTHKETMEFLESYRERGEILCPDGGEFDAVERGSMSMEVVCCRHDSDGGRKALLCAERVLDRVRKEVRTKQICGTAFPDTVQVTLNSRPLTAERVEQPTGLRRGTATTAGYKGIVAFYAIAVQPEKEVGAEPGDVWYFSFADEDHAVTWTLWDGWRLEG